MRIQSMTRRDAHRQLQRYPYDPILRFHPTEPDLLIVSYLFEERPMHTLVSYGSIFQEVQLVKGHLIPLTNRFLTIDDLEAFVRNLMEDNPRPPSPLTSLSPLEPGSL